MKKVLVVVGLAVVLLAAGAVGLGLARRGSATDVSCGGSRPVADGIGDGDRYGQLGGDGGRTARHAATLPTSGSTSLRWCARVAADFTGPPLVEGGSVFVADRDRHLVKLSLRTGEVQWRSELVVADPSSGVVSDGVFFGTAIRSGQDVLVAVSVADGSERWTAPLPDGTPRGAMALAGATLVVSGAQGGSPRTSWVTSYDVTNGARRWGAEVDGLVTEVATDEAHVVVWRRSGDGAVQELWTFAAEDGRREGAPIPVAPTSHLALDGGAVLVAGPGAGAGAVGVSSWDLTSGAARWRQEIPDARGCSVQAVAIAGDSVVVGVLEGTSDAAEVKDRCRATWSLASADGAQRWRSPLLADVAETAPGTLSGIMASGSEGVIAALPAGGGTPQPRTPVTRSMGLPTLVIGGQVLVLDDQQHELRSFG